MSTVAQLDWLPYLRPSFGSRPTAKVIDFSPPSKVISGEPSRPAKEPKLFALHTQIDRIAALPDDWDGHSSVRPHPTSVENGRQFLEEAYRQTILTAGWQSPHISASEDGELVFEWWSGNRKLTAYVGPQEATYIKSWGPHILNDMEDGVLQGENFPSLWLWLYE